MRAITIRQPWAWAVAAGHKDVENRSRPTGYRGLLAIHAGSGWSRRGQHDERVAEAAHRLIYRDTAAVLHPAARAMSAALGMEPSAAAFTRSAFVAVAELADCHPDTGCCRPWGESEYQEAGGRTRTVIYHLRLEAVRALPEPIPYTGRLGLWTPDDATVRHLIDWYTRKDIR